MTEHSKVAPVEAQAVPDLHQQIMNLPCVRLDGWGSVESSCYARGHRDARHAAAQLVAASPAAAADEPGLDEFEEAVQESGIELVAASPAAAAGVPTHIHEAWWLVELRDAPTPLYLSGTEWKAGRRGRTWPDFGPDIPVETFTNEAAKAIRFPSKESAERVLEALMGQRCDTAANTALSLVHRHLGKYRVAEHIFDYTPRASSPVAPVGAPTRQLEELIDQYWTLAYAEGKEGRNHDTEDGAAQQCLHDIKEAIALLSRQGCELATDATKHAQSHTPKAPQ